MPDKHFIRTNIPPTASIMELVARQAQQLTGRNMRVVLGTHFENSSYWTSDGSGTVGFSTTKAHTLVLLTNEEGDATINVTPSVGGLEPRHIINPRTDRYLFYARGRMVSGVANTSTSKQGFAMYDSGGRPGDPMAMIGAVGVVSTTHFQGAIFTAGGSSAAVEGPLLDTLFHDFHIFNDVDDGLVRFYMDGVEFGSIDGTTQDISARVIAAFCNNGDNSAAHSIEVDCMYVAVEQASN